MTEQAAVEAKPGVATDPDSVEVMEGREREQLEGWIPSLAGEAEIRDALEKAFDYRGDVTLTLKDGRVVNGYVFDRRTGKTLADSAVRIIPAGERTKLGIPYAEIAALAFTGRDNAAGRTFEAWIRKYWEKKAAGEKNIGIEAETLD
jgi:transcriptional antiterminator Rof (Rho-off)